MTQMIQQISVEQASGASSSRNTQTVAASSAQNAGTFRAVVRAAAGSAEKAAEKPGEPAGEKKNQDSEEKLTGGLPVQILFPVIVLPLSAAQAAGVQQGPAAGVQTAVQENVSEELLPPSAQVSGPLVRQSLQNSEAGSLPEAIPEAPQAETSTSVPVVQTGTTLETASGVASGVTSGMHAAKTVDSGGDQLPQPLTGSAEKAPESLPSERTYLPQAAVSDPVSSDGRAEIKVSGATAQTEKKEETSEKDSRAAQLDLYADGNVVIKVSDAKTAQAPEAARQVAQAVVQQQKQGKQEFQVELYPQNLGKVSVKLSSANGVLTVEISASNPKTQSLLLSGSDGIRSMLQSSTGKNVNVIQAEQSAGWYTPQDGGNSEGGRQGQNEDKRRESGGWRRTQITGAGGVGGMDTGNFLSLMQQIAQ